MFVFTLKFRCDGSECPKNSVEKYSFRLPTHFLNFRLTGMCKLFVTIHYLIENERNFFMVSLTTWKNVTKIKQKQNKCEQWNENLRINRMRKFDFINLQKNDFFLCMRKNVTSNINDPAGANTMNTMSCGGRCLNFWTSNTTDISIGCASIGAHHMCVRNKCETHVF